ncbi:MAG: thioredoxin family protein [Bacteroidetes bacterium]|nr:thioredoxin family protein [Bacteroidota bacterium]
MKKMMKFSIVMFLIIAFTLTITAQDINPEITFIELGSVSCIPCKKMQPIMKSLEKKYGEQLKIIFYDVWKSEHKDKAKKYGIRLIPTQVFLDENGIEIHRHEGYYPEEKIDEFLQSKGLKPNKQKVSK